METGYPRAELFEKGLTQEAAIGEKLNSERSNDGRKSDSRPNQEVASLHGHRLCHLRHNEPVPCVAIQLGHVDGAQRS